MASSQLDNPIKLCNDCGLNPRYGHYSYCRDCRNKKRKDKRANDPTWRENEAQKRRERNARQPQCERQDCPNLSTAKGLCNKHRQEDRRNDPLSERCSTGCGRAVTSKGLCNACYVANRRDDAGIGLYPQQEENERHQATADVW